MANTKIPIELSSTPSIVDNGNATAITIDSSENILVGKSVANTSTVGIEARENGLLVATRDGGQPLLIDRLTNDGDLVLFRKDSSTVGSISNSGTNLIVGGSGTNKSGFYFGDSALFPVKNGNLSASTISFGSPNYRFKDLYLNGKADIDISTDARLTINSDIGEVGDGNVALQATNSAGSALKPMGFRAEDIRFATGSAERLRIDSSGDLNIVNTGQASLNYTTDGSLDYARITGGKSGSGVGDLRFFTYSGGMAERMRIDSSGNLFVGTTVTNPAGNNSVGVAISSGSYGGFIGVTRDGNTPVEINRKTSDGTLITFRKDSSSVGSISSNGGSASYNSNNGVIYLGHNQTNHFKFLTSQATGQPRFEPSGDNAIDVGRAALRFKDLYLSGNAYVGNAVTSSTDGSSDLKLEGNQHIFRKGVAGSYTERMRIDSSGNVGIGTSSVTQGKVDILAGGDYDAHTGHGLTINSSANNAFTSMYMGADDSVDAAYIQSAGRNTSFTSKKLLLNPNGGNVGIGTDSPYKSLTVGDSDASAWITSGGANTHLTLSANGVSGAVIFRTGGTNGDPSATTERMRIASDGTLQTRSSDGLAPTVGSGCVSIWGRSGSSSTGVLRVYKTGDDGQIVDFYRTGNTLVGNISVTSSATSYNTSSDYRLKENVDYDFTALDRVAQLKPARFNFIADADTTVDGFLAHEVQDIIPEAVTGEKDAVKEEEYEVTPAVLDDDGNVITEAEMGTREVPDYQGIDQSKLVPLLTKAIQEQQELINNLTSRIEELEN